MDASKMQEVRKANLRLLANVWQGTTKLAERLTKAGLKYKDTSYLTQMMGKQRPVSEGKAREIEAALGLPDRWMDTPSKAEVAPQVHELVAECITLMKEQLRLQKPAEQTLDLLTLMVRDAARAGKPDPEHMHLLAHALLPGVSKRA